MSAEGKSVLSRYKNYASGRMAFIFASLSILLILSAYSVSTGTVKIPISKVISAFLGQIQGSTYRIIWNIRLPRVLAAIVAGMGLSVAGASMQSILRNPLGSPYTLGISHSAAFGAAFSIVVLGAGSLGSNGSNPIILNNPYITTLSAFAWALVSTLVILLLAKYRGVSPETMILTGVALGSLFTAGTTAIQYFASDIEIASIVFWTFGDVGRATWGNLIIMSIAVIPVSLYFIYNSWNYNALDSGDETAKSLGVDVEKTRARGMLLASFITALIVSFVGIIGFIGLVVPHIVRKIIGGNEVFLIPSSCILGGIILLASDTLARTIISPIVLPVGILTSFLGAPLFIYLVIRGREYW